MNKFFNNRPIRKKECIKLNANDFSGVEVTTAIAPWFHRILPAFITLSKFYEKGLRSEVKIPLDFKNPIPLKVKGGKILTFDTAKTRV